MSRCQGQIRRWEKKSMMVYYVFFSSSDTKNHTLDLLMNKDSKITWQLIIYQYRCKRALSDDGHGEIEGDLLD